jgi:hypothetical protein
MYMELFIFFFLLVYIPEFTFACQLKMKGKGIKKAMRLINRCKLVWNNDGDGTLWSSVVGPVSVSFGMEVRGMRDGLVESRLERSSPGGPFISASRHSVSFSRQSFHRSLMLIPCPLKRCLWGIEYIIIYIGKE